MIFSPKPKTGLLSPTKLQSWLYCAWACKQEHFEGVPRKSASKALVRGVIGHKMLELMDNTNLTHRQIFDEGVAYFENPPEGEARLIMDRDERETMYEELNAMISGYYRTANKMGVTHLEHEVYRTFEYAGHKMEGTVDIYFTLPDTPEGMVELGDYKFGQKQNDTQLNRNIQQGLYWESDHQRGVHVHRNWWISMGDFIPYKRKTKGKEAGDLRGPGFYPIAISEADSGSLLTMVLPILNCIDRGCFPINSYGDACRSCHYIHLCPRFLVGREKENECYDF